jgi:AraC family transcriptional regulator
MFPVRQFSGTHFTACLVDYRQSLCHDWHAHDDPIVTLVVSGQVEEAVPRETRQVTALDVGFKPAGIRHADRFGDCGVRAVRISLGPILFAAVEEAASGTLEWGWTPRSPAVAPLMRVATQLCGAPASEADLLTDLHDALSALGADRPRKLSACPAAWLRHVREAIDDSQRSGPRLSELAATAGVHPVYLARQFRRQYGCSVGQYIRWRRVAATAALLGDRRRPIASIAADVGCSDQSHLTRDVRAAAGVTPGMLRRLMTVACGGQVQNVQDNANGR